MDAPGAAKTAAEVCVDRCTVPGSGFMFCVKDQKIFFSTIVLLRVISLKVENTPSVPMPLSL